MRQTFPTGCASAASGIASRLRMRVTMDQTALYPMVISSHRPHADCLLSMEAERCGSGAADSGSEGRADAVYRRLQAGC